MTQSMTAFARCSDQDTWGMASWEIRVVNHRYFECVLKMPEVFRYLESKIRLELQKQLQRGRVECFLKFEHSEQNEEKLALNTVLVKKLLEAVQTVKGYLPMSTVDPMKILSWPNVLQTTELDPSVAETKIRSLFEKALTELVATREREGVVLTQLIRDRLQEMLTVIAKVSDKIPQVLAEQRVKITQRLAEVTSSLDQSRLEQELVYLAQKIDIAEEIDRLRAHIAEVSRVLNENVAAGKRLDFLMQELNREANTLAAKSVDIEITRAAVDLKVLIEQMREQVQNLV